MNNTKIFLYTCLVLTALYSQYKANAQEPVRVEVQTGHLTDIIDYDVRSDGKYLISLDKSGTAIIWDLTTSSQIRSLSGREADGGVKKVSFLRTRNKKDVIAALQSDKVTDFINVATGRRIGILENTQTGQRTANNDFDVTIHGNKIIVRRVKDNLVVATLEPQADETRNVRDITYDINPDSKTCGHYCWVGSRTPVLWDFQEYKIAKRITNAEPSGELFFDIDGNSAFVDKNGILRRYDRLEAFQIDSMQLPIHKPVDKLLFMPNRKEIVYSRDGQLSYINTETGKSADIPFLQDIKDRTIFSPKDKGLKISGLVYSMHKDSLYIALNSSNKIYKLRAGDKWMRPCFITSAPPKKLDLIYLKKNYLLFAVGDTTVSCFTSPMNSAIDILSYSRSSLSPSRGKFTSEFILYDRIVIGDTQGYLSMYGLPNDNEYNGYLEKTFKVCNGRINNIHTTFISTSNGFIQCLNEKEEIACSLVSVNEGKDFIIVTPDNYYMASPEALDAIRFIKGVRTFNFDQFDMRYNRPDIVVERIDETDTTRIRMLQRAWEKRLRRNGFEKEMLSDEFHTPSISLNNTDEVVNSTSSSQILQITASDELYAIHSINVWLNGVPVFGSKGYRVSQNKKISMTLPIVFASGKNNLEISCTNNRGAESDRIKVVVNIPESSAKPDLYIIAFGASQYTDSRFNLKYAASDADKFTMTMSEINLADYNQVHTMLYTNENVNRQSLKKAKECLKAAKRDDAVILYYAGHGLLSKDYDYYLASHDTDFRHPENSALPYEELESLLDGIMPLRKLMFIDACHSGEIDKEDIETVITSNKPLSTGQVVFRNTGAEIATKVSIEELNRLISTYFADIRRGTGATILSSASGTEVAVEGDNWKGGLFTHILLDGLTNFKADIDNDGTIMSDELQKFVTDEVTAISAGRQQPALRSQNYQQSFVLGRR